MPAFEASYRLKYAYFHSTKSFVNTICFDVSGFYQFISLWSMIKYGDVCHAVVNFNPCNAETDNIPGGPAQYHGYWCPGSLCRHGISSHVIDYTADKQIIVFH